MSKPIQVAMFTLPWRQLRSHPDVGDWMVNADNSPAVICAADTGNDASNAALLLHEFVEAYLCYLHAVSEESVTAFDREFFRKQETGEIPNDAEPGNDPKAPYYQEHQDAMQIERMFLTKCGVRWLEHCKRCDQFNNENKKEPD